MEQMQSWEVGGGVPLLGAAVVQSLSHVRLFATPWTAAHQAPLSMGLSRQEYWSWVPLTSPSLTKEEYTMEYTMEKRQSLTSGAGKTGQAPVKECN